MEDHPPIFLLQYPHPFEAPPAPAAPIIEAPPAPAAPAAPAPPINKFEYLVTPENIINVLGPKGGLTANTYIKAIEAYNLANPGSTIDLTGLNKEDFGSTHSIYRRQLAHHLEGKVRIVDTVRGFSLYDK